jgi:hypothetical protein
VLVAFVACSGSDLSDVRPIEFTSQNVSEGFGPKWLEFTWAVNETKGIDNYQPVEIDYFQLEVNPDGASGYSQADLNGDGQLNNLDRRPATAVSSEAFLAVHLTDLNNARYQIVARDSSDAELARSGELFLVDLAVQQLIGYFKASNTDAGDAFGPVSLSGDGNTLAVGAVGEASNATGIDGDESDNSAQDAGAVYVFRRDAGGIWSQEAYLKASNTDAFDRFGRSVSLSQDGSTLAVGADGESSNATGVGGNQGDNSLSNSGAVYVFRRDAAGTWSQEAYVKASNTGASDSFGWRVSLAANGSTLAVGAVGEASNDIGVDGDEIDDSAPDAGAVYVFRRNFFNVWSQDAYVKASNTDAGDEFGSSVSLSPLGTALAVGAVGEASNATGVDDEDDDEDDLDQADNSAVDAGAVYVFRRAGGAWSQQAYVKASNTDAGDEFGSSVSLSRTGNALIVGAVGEASSATGIGGDESNNDQFDAGAAYGYVYITSPPAEVGWEQDAYIKASNTGGGDEFGVAVSLTEDGNLLAVGATGEDSGATGTGGDEGDDSLSDSGAAYTFRREPEEDWAQVTYVKASNTDAGDEFGLGVSLSANGNTLAVGAELEDSNATGIGGDQSDNSADAAGAVYLY